MGNVLSLPKLNDPTYKIFILTPYFQIKKATRKNRADLLTAEANKNKGKEILIAPADIVNTL